jgi:hypothetical protein
MFPSLEACKESHDSSYLHEFINMSSHWDLLVATATQVNVDDNIRSLALADPEKLMGSNFQEASLPW